MARTLENPRKIIAIFGEAGSGKTTYINNLVNVDARLAFREIDESLFTCTHDQVDHIIVTSYGNEEYDVSHREYLANAKFACILIDTTRMLSIISAESLISYARKICGENIPIVLCMNKCMSSQSNINMNNMIQYNHENRDRNMRMICVDHVHRYNSDFIFYV